MATLQNAGKAIITNRIKGSGTEPNYVAWGTTATAEDATQTALAAESTEARTAGTSSQVTTTVTNDSYQVVGTLTATGARAIVEAGLFDAVTTGNMFVRGIFSVINLATGDSIQFTIKTAFA